MKKIFTLLMLSIFTVMNVNAEEQVLWESETGVDINWGDNPEDQVVANPTKGLYIINGKKVVIK